MSVYQKMRSYICMSYQGRQYKLVWFNEDSKGIYMGHYGMIEGVHLSYHIDGTKHFKLPDSNDYLQEHQGLPINQISSFVQIGFEEIPLYPQMMAITGNEYQQDDKTSTNAIFIDASLMSEDKIGLDSYIINRKMEKAFIDYLYSDRYKQHHGILVCNIFALSSFPQHKLGLVILKGNKETQIP